MSKLKIDFNSRLKRLAEIFYTKSTREALGANKEITNMLGEYKQVEGKVAEMFDNTDLKE